jgi:hypothetical protein
MSQDTSTTLEPSRRDAHVAVMRTQNDHRPTTAMIILGTVSLAALLLLATGTPAAAVKDVLAIILPPLVAVAAHSERGDRR